MSADNWTVCPRCEAARAATAKQYADEAAEAYGKVAPAEFERLTQKAKEFEAAPTPDTLREDYEIGICDGIFSVIYHAACDCGFKYAFRMNTTPNYETNP